MMRNIPSVTEFFKAVIMKMHQGDTKELRMNVYSDEF